MSFNVKAVVTICSDFGAIAEKKNEEKQFAEKVLKTNNKIMCLKINS